MNLTSLKKELEGELFTDNTIRRLYATDASAYREIPLAVAIPKSEDDIVALIRFAIKHKTSVIPRTAGTSLAGQVVGAGIVVDVSKHFNKIVEINKEEGWAIVQPGIVRDDLNNHLKQFGYFFAPETSTANRAMIGGMIGNNSCGSNSVVYGSTREHLLEVNAILADGSQVWFGALTEEQFNARIHASDETLETKLYKHIYNLLSDKENLKEIEKEFPKPSIQRRNTGYAIDMLARMQPFKTNGGAFNFCSLIAGSEGTLAFVTSAKIKLTPLDPPHKKLVCIHCKSIDESLHANLVALKHNPSAVELMDHYVFEATKRNIGQIENRFFIEGEPQAILVAELTRASEEKAITDAKALIEDLKNNGLGYSYPIVGGDDIKKVWNLRKAGLGLLSNVPGDEKPVPVIEDTAVAVEDLPAYIADVGEVLKKHGLYSVHYAHAGSGELHLRPIIDLKTTEGVQLFRTIAEEIATLVKKYRGSLSGEHGDGRLRGEFIKQMIGEHNYTLIKELKYTWDPDNVFNPGKIVDTPPMDTFLRFEKDQVTKEFDTILDFSETMGVLRTAEQCNGSGDCRKTHISGGTMCPSYMATRNEKDTTRARANILREMITRSDKSNPFAHEEIKEVMDLCLSCKGCKSECPSNVDMGKLKQEWQYQYYKEKGVPLRSRLIGNFALTMKLASLAPWGYNFIFNNRVLGNTMKTLIGFAPDRSMPHLSPITWKKWFRKKFKPTVKTPVRTVYLFIDELLNYNEAEIGILTVQLLDRLGYEVKVLDHFDSGRSFLSKGLLEEARDLAKKNVALFKDHITADTPLIGVEPSAILTFRDEYPDLLRGKEKESALQVASHTLMIDEFLSKELDAGRIDVNLFKQQKALIKLHGHCQQKALSTLTHLKKLLTRLGNNEVHLIPSGCCGMAGSFGYEKEHYDLSMQIGELVLFPAVRKQPDNVIIAAPGTSCRHQIKDGTSRKALHPVEILWDALIK
ncbi:FAD-binding and (Fe-S)-binding domain-containing protein [Chryseosolibacter indicus]|uniref:FAD-binding protein n=1 Tax=Chryseosolibacter indicus TaxID=2782351 RepID=A0ABS5VXT9_9BACT|nr:FAD-binding and (Fe-S)-binding domain-containing protein [Chryseosolibacter indicus]MBT1706228.1 FAD-binding protein [Chryseosolibacter indicus]